MSYYFEKLRSRVSQLIVHLGHTLTLLLPLCHQMMTLPQVQQPIPIAPSTLTRVKGIGKEADFKAMRTPPSRRECLTNNSAHEQTVYHPF